ncbi:MAG: malonyl-ACP O-methyltransferase BioC [Xanthomonadales bacterium]|nr:Malonyl-[acyl-carrier protein] O-methyltransferase [Xanthomonadales bacterium]MCC6593657.1 malonyl-ACP O-methyltransferase BioC [Xanthomonadales bacterium]MCE7931531.1 malonyl-[acyl-carrier protein] O-methyltransferase BioC [Xanthomonadales bacterium PRO6]
MPLDRARIRAAFTRAAVDYERSAVLQGQVGDLLLERLDRVREPPARVLDAGAGSGRLARLLKRRWPQAEVVALDLALGMLQQARRKGSWWRPLRCISGDAQALPFADASFDLLVSNLCLQWCDPHAVFREFRRVLRPSGWLLATSFGPDTLRELRAAWRAADAGAHVHVFLDLHDLGDAALAQGFVDPVLDVERFRLHYPDARTLMRELKGIGAGNALGERARGLTGRAAFARMLAAYECERVAQGLPASYEVIFVQAQAPQAGAPLRGPRGDLASFSLESMRRQLRREPR